MLPTLLIVSAIATGWLSAWALFRASPHGRGEALRWRAGNPIGLLLAIVSLLLWIIELGVGAGISVMLGNWMLALMTLPYLGLRRSWRAAESRRGDPRVDGERI